MKTTTRAASPLSLMIVLGAACGGSPAASELPSSPSVTRSSVPRSLLPDGIWEAELTVDDLAAAAPEGAADPGRYRLTFDGARARIAFESDWQCDADAEADGDAVRLQWHPATNCGGFDTVKWIVNEDGLHLELADTSGNEAGSVAVFETEPFLPIEGDATLSWSDAWLTCENPEGGACLGELTSGTYSSEAFIPGLTYTVPEGWQNVSDLEGEVVLFPPGQPLDAAHPEYVAVFTSVRAENRSCRTEEEAITEQPGVRTTAEAIAAEFGERPGLSATEPQPVTVGGLSGLVMDISMADDWTGTCFYSDGPVVQFLGGVWPSHFHHSIEPGQTVRLYLFGQGESTMAIEIADYADGAQLDTLTDIAEQLDFGDH